MDSLRILDGVVSERELGRWQARVRTGVPSTGLTEDDVAGTELYALARAHAPGPLIHGLLFDLGAGHETEMHRDVGEYVVLFYPYDCPGCPLRVDEGGGTRDVEVRENRMVVLDCTVVSHQQVVPTGDARRYSVAFKFRRPMGGA